MIGSAQMRTRVGRRLRRLKSRDRRPNRADRLKAWLAAGSVLRRLRRDRSPDPEMIFATVRRLAEVGLVRRGHSVIDTAGRHGADPRDVLRARRLLPKHAGRVAGTILRRAAVAAGAGPGLWLSRTPVSCLVGRGADVEAVVRHRLPGGRTMIRKTLIGDQPREVSAYLSGYLTGGRGWRVPRLHHAEPEIGPDGVRWHLFLEDLGPIQRIEEPQLIISAARSLGELNGSRLDDPTLRSVSWLVDRVEPYRRLDELRDAGLALTGTVAPETAKRVREVLDRLSARRIELRDRYLALPMTLCHGDPTRSNLTNRDGQTIMFDLSSCAYAPIGSDLGGLLALPNPAIRHRRLSITDALDAYLAGIRQTVEPDQDAVGFGFRYRLLIKSFAWQLVRLPPALDARPTPDLPADRIAIKRASVEADLCWLCDQADLLLQTR
ncbi:phosphotransferase [Microlunatus speluncae]|uniref:phosphotransferase n=1 Tax=Microlunatus speluncae TaxID=2594267 RepID=UPI0012668568|nr:phosphotransferase [Microlunatus speluncae]